MTSLEKSPSVSPTNAKSLSEDCKDMSKQGENLNCLENKVGNSTQEELGVASCCFCCFGVFVCFPLFTVSLSTKRLFCLLAQQKAR